MNSVTNAAGRTFTVGQRVRHNDGWTGQVTRIRERPDGLIVLHVEPDADWAGRVPGSWPLNPEAAARAGRSDFVTGRDHGLSMGNWTVLS